MDIIEIAKIELLKMGMFPDDAARFAKEFLIGFPKLIAEKYAAQKFKEGAAAQRLICSETNLLSKYGSTLGLELTHAIKKEVLTATEPEYK